MVGRERVGGAAAAVQGVHEHHGRAFPGGVAAHEGLQFGDGLRGPAEAHQRFEAGPRPLRPATRSAARLRPRRTPGRRTRRGRRRARARDPASNRCSATAWSSSRRHAAPRRGAFEGRGVELGAVEREDVAGGLEAQPCPARARLAAGRRRRATRTPRRAAATRPRARPPGGRRTRPGPPRPAGPRAAPAASGRRARPDPVVSTVQRAQNRNCIPPPRNRTETPFRTLAGPLRGGPACQARGLMFWLRRNTLSGS